MGGSSSSSMKMVLVIGFVIAVVMIQINGSDGQQQSNTCASELTGLNVCAPFVVPGSSNNSPSADCCGALQSVDHDCFCNTLRVVSQLPSSCNLPAITCGN